MTVLSQQMLQWFHENRIGSIYKVKTTIYMSDTRKHRISNGTILLLIRVNLFNGGWLEFLDNNTKQIQIIHLAYLYPSDKHKTYEIIGCELITEAS